MCVFETRRSIFFVLFCLLLTYLLRGWGFYLSTCRQPQARVIYISTKDEPCTKGLQPGYRKFNQLARYAVLCVLDFYYSVTPAPISIFLCSFASTYYSYGYREPCDSCLLRPHISSSPRLTCSLLTISMAAMLQVLSAPYLP